jgi:O-antigen/teichoic acid export membrane protein
LGQGGWGPFSSAGHVSQLNRILDATRRLFSPEQKSTSRKVTRNVILSGLRGVLVWPIPFLIIPFILVKVGPEGYGVWAVLLTIIKLTAISDVGMGGTLTKYVAEYYIVRDTGSLNDLINTALMLYCSVAFLIFVALSVGASRILPLLFHRSIFEETSLRVLWGCLLVILMVNILTIPFYSILAGLQRMDLTNMVSSFNSVCAGALVFLLLSIGWAMPGLLVAYLVAAMLSLSIYVLTVRRLLPMLSLNPFRCRRKEIPKIMAFSVQIYVTGVAVTISNEVEKLYLAWLVGVVPVGWYDVASQAAQRIRRIPELLLGPLMPAVTELDVQGEHEKLEELYYRAHKYLALIAVPLIFYVAAVSRRLIHLWVGPKLTIVAIPLAVLAASSLFNLTSGPGLLTLIGKGILRPGVYSAMLGIFLNLTLSFWLIYSRGFSGAVIGTTAAQVIATIFFLVTFRKEMGAFSTKSVSKAYLKPSIVAAVITFFLVIFAPFDHLGWAGLGLGALLFGVTYLVGLTLVGFFDAFDVDRVECLFPFTRYLRRFIPVA